MDPTHSKRVTDYPSPKMMFYFVNGAGSVSTLKVPSRRLRPDKGRKFCPCINTLGCLNILLSFGRALLLGWVRRQAAHIGLAFFMWLHQLRASTDAKRLAIQLSTTRGSQPIALSPILTGDGNRPAAMSRYRLARLLPTRASTDGRRSMLRRFSNMRSSAPINAQVVSGVGHHCAQADA
ncbi:Hypothetical Protein XCAW_02410 [Xanthomonas citri subsp. citri Aw12879]|uniref:Uncharacterized protein n=1 Tax=Xanthomonas axonopodis pv. citri (strain 306) TaxID=190486 RepID=A0AAI7ZES6_XANAC|nr:hypothetical protein XAC1663 [Xanthomonas citri pv. citri str. 306]AGI08194.1 Hypothetical Protein XCAW_02410 [Xanthomonas citri subsp. citri Aw12879]